MASVAKKSGKSKRVGKSLAHHGVAPTERADSASLHGGAKPVSAEDLSPTQFQTQVFDVLARDLDVLSDLGENSAGFEGWCAFQNLVARIELAGKIAEVIGGAS